MGNCNSATYNDEQYTADLSISIPSRRKTTRNIPSTGQVKVLSYNIFIRPPMIKNNDDDFKDERLLEFIKVMDNYDVICLQEMFGSFSGRKSLLIQAAQERGFLYSAESPKPATFSTFLIDGGLLILSKFPISTQEFMTYPQGIGSDALAQKGVLYSEIMIGSSKLHLYNTHAQATYDGTAKYFIKRTEQFVCFKNFVNKTLAKQEYNDDDLVLFTGDFNVNGRDSQKLYVQEMEQNPALSQFTSQAKANGFSEYEAMISCLSDNHQDELHDVLHKNNGEHPTTYGDYYLNENMEKKPKELALTCKSTHCVDESLDYILRYVPRTTGSNDIKAKLPLTIIQESAGVEKFLITGHPFDQLSDHYGVTVTLQYNGSSDLDKSEAETAMESPSPSLNFPIDTRV
jgi:endonuclease/exonuclease/phosphatase family metal-dependent hydrolase